MNFKTIAINKHKYLRPLGELAKPPSALFMRGELPADRIPTVAIVGSRKPSAYGKEVTQKLASELAQKGIVIVSGLAYGIDAIAHRAALEVGGTTIAILGNAIDTVYPLQHAPLAGEIIAAGGAVISEYAPDTITHKSNFLARNRLISGIADAVIVTEAAERSGTLSTINHALEQGKEVFAVPGNITSPLSAGCNAVIKQGAMPLTGSQDVVEALQLNPSYARIRSSTTNATHSEDELIILKLIKRGTTTSEALLETSGLETSAFLQVMTILELEGTIISEDKVNWRLR